MAASLAGTGCGDEPVVQEPVRTLAVTTETAPPVTVTIVETAPASRIDTERLPLGDGRHSDSPQRGYLFSCTTDFDSARAAKPGAWVDEQSGTWSLDDKPVVEGTVQTLPTFSTGLSAESLQISSNGLPRHDTGSFRARKGKRIRQYDLFAVLPRNPQPAGEPTCIGDAVGIMKSGAALHSPLDETGSDAAARELNDRCNGHPDADGRYHYHFLPACIDDTASAVEHSALLGWALDGFGIYGLRGEGGVPLSSEQLDECHGHQHVAEWNGSGVDIFHYHLTYDFPYAVGCFRAVPTGESRGLVPEN